jgi:hypothetical protein
MAMISYNEYIVMFYRSTLLFVCLLAIPFQIRAQQEADTSYNPEIREPTWNPAEEE